MIVSAFIAPMARPVSETLVELERWGRERSWRGPDPYEGLNTPAGRMARSRRSRQLVIQAYKRFSFPPPPPFRAPVRDNSKALGLALSGYARPAGRRFERAETMLEELSRRLERLNLRTDGAAWGYGFDVQTRHLFYDRHTPNAIATCFAVHGLLDAHRSTGEESLAELALAARPFLVSLSRRRPEGRFFAYVEAGSELIHNASLLVCGTLARLDELDPEPSCAELVPAAVETTIAAQRDDGLWPYGEASNLTWCDSFHTSYLLEGLHRVSLRWGIGSEALVRGTAAWRSRFFEPDGWARYYPDRRYPLEPHSYASAIDLLCLLASDPRTGAGAGELAAAETVARSAIRELWLEDEGRFAFRRTARGLNRREYMRWTNALMFRALATLVSAQTPSEAAPAERIA